MNNFSLGLKLEKALYMGAFLMQKKKAYLRV